MRSLFEMVVVPLDGSEPSFDALKLAISACSLYEGSIVAVSVVDEDVVSQLSRMEARGRAGVERDLERNNMRFLTLAERMGRDAGVKVEKSLRRGVPYLQIVEEAKARDATLIIMGKVGRRGPRRLLMGNVTERVIEYAECPVLVTV